MGYQCANFGLPMLFYAILCFLCCSRLRPDVRDRQRDKTYVSQTDVRQKHRLMPPPIRGGGTIIYGIRVLINVYELTVEIISSITNLSNAVFRKICHLLAKMQITDVTKI